MENKLLEYLENHQPATPSNWREKTEWRRENRDWIRHSQEIALAMLNKMDELKMSQTALAKQLGCSQQYVSKLLKGGENLSLETISKIEKALTITIILPLCGGQTDSTIMCSANATADSELYSLSLHGALPGLLWKGGIKNYSLGAVDDAGFMEFVNE